MCSARLCGLECVQDIEMIHVPMFIDMCASQMCVFIHSTLICIVTTKFLKY